MQYDLVFAKKVKKVFHKLENRNPSLLLAIQKKVEEIAQHPHRYKNLRAPLQDYKSVHFGHFVLLFSVNETTMTVILEDFDHHDRIYEKP
ncbi:type II toxin-antitoxin system RelE/ParE family toxin [Candidatus Woesearchaeota archaeon]|nr:type II toxin-antitoxin system RelE/ParE family toxin [Candidatus Woesearchaeota archaeon]